MALIQNLPIFIQNGGHFVCYDGNGGSGKKKLNIFLLSLTHSTNWPEKITLNMQISKKSHRAAVSHLNMIKPFRWQIFYR